jgi:hypothetical protein
MWGIWGGKIEGWGIEKEVTEASKRGRLGVLFSTEKMCCST